MLKTFSMYHIIYAMQPNMINLNRESATGTNPSTWLNFNVAKKVVGLENFQHEVSLVELGLEDIEIELC